VNGGNGGNGVPKTMFVTNEESGFGKLTGLTSEEVEEYKQRQKESLSEGGENGVVM